MNIYFFYSEICQPFIRTKQKQNINWTKPEAKKYRGGFFKMLTYCNITKNTISHVYKKQTQSRFNRFQKQKNLNDHIIERDCHPILSLIESCMAGDRKIREEPLRVYKFLHCSFDFNQCKENGGALEKSDGNGLSLDNSFWATVYVYYVALPCLLLADSHISRIFITPSQQEHFPSELSTALSAQLYFYLNLNLLEMTSGNTLGSC